MEKQEYTMNQVIHHLVRDMKKQQLLTCEELDRYIDKEINSKMGSFACKSDKILVELKQILFDTAVRSPYKFLVIMYSSLLFAQNQLTSGLLSFYYEFSSYALKELKEGPDQPQQLWSIVFEKIYYFGLLLLAGNRTLLLSMQTFGTRVNSQLLASKSQCNKMSKLVRVYNCVLSIPQKFLSLNQVLTFTLIFTRWNLSEDDPFSLSFFASFQRKTQKKLIKKLKKYPRVEFTQEHLLNLIKIVVCGEELILSYFLQAKFIYESAKQENSQGKQRPAVEGLLKVTIPRQCKLLFNLIIELLLEAPEQALRDIERQSIIYIALKCIAGKFQNNEGLFTILISHFLSEKNNNISHISFRIIREEALIYLTVYKMKLLLNLFNRSSWKSLITAGVTGQTVINRLQRMILLLSAIGRRYNDENLNLACLPNRCALAIQNVRDVKSIVFVVVFDSIGRLSEPSKMETCLLRIRMDKGSKIEVLVNFDQNPERFSIEPRKQLRQRTALVIVRQGNKKMLQERKQYIRFGQGNYESLIAASLCDGGKLLNLSIDGAYYQMPLDKKNQIKGFEIGQCFGCIRSFYSLNCEMQLIELYKKWCECERKTKYVIQSYGFQRYCYLLNTHQEPPVLQLEEEKWSLFQRKTDIKILQAIKQHKIIETYLQLGGLETIFFVLERLSRSFEELEGCEQKIVELLKNFFEMLRLTAYFDEKYQFLDDIIKSFKFINPFLYLLINRNTTIRRAEDSRLLLSFFELIVYFQRDKHRVLSNPEVQVKMAKIQTKLVISTLANFQLWSNCSLPIQMFILSLIESYISNGKYIVQLVRRDLHKELLSSIVLFSTSENNLLPYEKLQTRLAEICLTLYRKIQKEYSKISALKESHLDKQGQKTSCFIQRDITLTIALIKSLSQRIVQRVFSESERSAFEVLLRYLSKNYLKNDFGWKMSQKYWPMCVYSLCNMVRINLRWTGDLGSLLMEVVMKYVSHQPSLDWWCLYFYNGFLDNSKTTVVDCLRVLHSLAEKYDQSTPGKTTIIAKIINKTAQKIQQQDGEALIEIRQQIFEQFNRLDVKTFFRISCYKDYNLLLSRLKEAYFISQIERTIWKSINCRLMNLLFKSAKIVPANRSLVTLLLLNIYEGDQNQIRQSQITKEDILKVQKIIQTHKNVQSQIKDNDSALGAYALIQHCRGWPALLYLLKQGLLTGSGDLPLPFDLSQLTQNQCPGGTISYYLAGKCGPLEIYLLLNIIIYRQLGNRLSFLSTIAPVSIFQKIIDLVASLNEIKPKEGFVEILVILLKEVTNSLNRSYVTRSSGAWKQLQKIFGNPEKQKKKASEALEALLKASNFVENTLQNSKPDEELSAFLDSILEKMKILNKTEEQEKQYNILLTLSEELKNPKQTYYRKLTMIGSRFFQVARQYWILTGLSDTDIDPINDKISEIKIKEEQVSLTFWNQLDQRYQDVLIQFNERGLAGEKHWKKLLISNEHWFQLQGDLDDISTKFYELDEKEVGPFGFYKLNIRPVKAQVRKLPYPRRKQYKQLIEQKEQEQKMKALAMSPKLSIETSTYFASVVDNNRFEAYQKSISVKEQQILSTREKTFKKVWWCQWVTKRGVYAGKLRWKNRQLIFTFTGHAELPQDVVYQESTNKCHWIQKLSEWEQQDIRQFFIPISGSEIFTRRYVLRHTAFQVFSRNAHRSYFFNLFFDKELQTLMDSFKGHNADVIQNRREQFQQRKFTAKWQKGQLTNFEYLSLINRYSGRSTNDLGQYLIMPWVLVNFTEKDTEKQNYMKFLTRKQNLRDLSLPTGKLNPEKFNKLKMRLNEIDPNDIEIRFLYGTMYSNPTIIYNFFIRLEPYTSLHWVHQGRKIDHADRLFSGVAQQFSTIMSSSSDNKELAPQFYYWPEFLRNRNLIQLGRKQKGDQVHSVVLPPWARSPEQFIFKMREVLESKVVSDNLHNWIDLIFGYKAPYEVAEQYDNLYHYQCYEHDIFTFYEDETQRKTAQIAISQFGQIPETLFFTKHLERQARKDIEIDQVIPLSKPGKGGILGFQLKGSGMIMWSNQSIIFKKAAIAGFYHNFEWSHEYQSNGECHVLSIKDQKWLTLSGGMLRLFEKKKMKEKRLVDAQCLQKMGDYLLIGIGSKIQIFRMSEDKIEMFSVLFGHHSDVVFIKTEPLLDVILSVDRTGLVLIHQLTELRFLRAFHLNIELTSEDVSKLKVCIHHMGYFIFLDHEQTIYVYNFLGEQLLEQQMQIKGSYDNEDEILTDIQLFSHHQPIILGSTSKGNIYVMNFLQIIRFKELYQYKNFSRLSKNLLSAVPKRSKNSIDKFSIVLSRGSSDTIYQFIVLYADGEVVCFIENRQMGRQLKDNYRLKSMGFV